MNESINHHDQAHADMQAVQDENDLQALIDDAKTAVQKLQTSLKSLSVFPDGKYASVRVEIRGNDSFSYSEVRAFLGDNLHIDADRASDVLYTLRGYDPAIARRKRIEELKRELSELSSKDEAKRSEIGGMA